MKPALHLCPSPNFNSRAAGKTINSVILHYTGLPNAAIARTRLCDGAAERKVSAHYLIEEQGKIWQLVDEAQRAWHAGTGSWRGETDMNSVSIGIELVNPGHEWGYRPFPTPQIASCIDLLKDIMERHNLPAAAVIGHSDMAPLRKEDPGELFPWAELAKHGIGLWPATLPSVTSPLPLSEVRTLLRQIGYDCPPDGDYDPTLRRILLAFQRHWHPTNLSGLADSGTTARLLAVAALSD